MNQTFYISMYSQPNSFMICHRIYPDVYVPSSPGPKILAVLPILLELGMHLQILIAVRTHQGLSELPFWHNRAYSLVLLNGLGQESLTLEQIQIIRVIIRQRRTMRTQKVNSIFSLKARSVYLFAIVAKCGLTLLPYWLSEILPAVQYICFAIVQHICFIFGSQLWTQILSLFERSLNRLKLMQLRGVLHGNAVHWLVQEDVPGYLVGLWCLDRYVSLLSNYHVWVWMVLSSDFWNCTSWSLDA